MSGLITSPNVARPDDIYQQLIELHAGRSDAESAIVNARLILLLINHVGDEEIVAQAIALAGRRDPEPAGEGASND